VLVGPEEREDLHVARVRRAAVHRLGREVGGAAHDLGQRRVLGVAEAGTPLLVRVEKVPEAALVRLGLELLEDRRVEVRVAAVGHLLRVDGLGRVDALVHERLDALHVVLGAVGQLEVHDLG
jgi:hypothetical protein